MVYIGFKLLQKRARFAQIDKAKRTKLDASSPGFVDDETSAWDIVADDDSLSPPEDFARKGSVETRKGNITPCM